MLKCGYFLYAVFGVNYFVAFKCLLRSIFIFEVKRQSIWNDLSTSPSSLKTTTTTTTKQKQQQKKPNNGNIFF